MKQYHPNIILDHIRVSPTGPLVLLVHGFPDTAYSWASTLEALAAAGFRAVAPFTRGYAPTEVPKEEAYDSDTLGSDVIALIRTARRKGLRHVYLGYRVEGCVSLQYKGRFRPQESLRGRVGEGEAPRWEQV